MIQAIRTVAAGGASYTFEQLRLGSAADAGGDDELSERELEVLQLLAEGTSTEAIAEALALSDRLVVQVVGQALALVLGDGDVALQEGDPPSDHRC